MHMLMRLVKLLRLLTIVALASPLAVFADLNSGLVALYTFDGNGINSAGPGLNLNGHDVTYGSGLFGQAASFNGQSSYFESADNVPITGNQSRTIDVWLNANSFTGRGNLVAWGPWQQAGDSFGTYLLDPTWVKPGPLSIGAIIPAAPRRLLMPSANGSTWRSFMTDWWMR
jgi:hypothetical protein